MTTEDLRRICMALKGATEDIKWEHDLCFSIGDKMFLVTGLDEQPVNASFKVSDAEFDELSAKPGFMPAPYMARHKWLRVEDISRLSKKQWQHYARQSYDLVKSKLPKKTLRELGLD